MSQKEFFCFKCQSKVSFAPPHPARGDECGTCRADLHCCMNCTHYDRSAYNDCREPQAERVVNKDRSNFCDFFAYREGKGAAQRTLGKDATMQKLDDLFKK